MTFRRLVRSALLIVALATACGDDSGTAVRAPNTTIVDDDPGEALPSWLAEVYPPPSANAAIEAAVEVTYNVLPPSHELRLVVDGIDVTTQAEGVERGGPPGLFPSPGSLRYDPRELERPLVPLDPGPHDAAVRLVHLPEPGAELVTVEDYAWSFQVQ